MGRGTDCHVRSSDERVCDLGVERRDAYELDRAYERANDSERDDHGEESSRDRCGGREGVDEQHGEETEDEAEGKGGEPRVEGTVAFRPGGGDPVRGQSRTMLDGR